MRPWPEIGDRRRLFFLPARHGQETLTVRRRQPAAPARIPTLVDTGMLLADEAWR